MLFLAFYKKTLELKSVKAFVKRNAHQSLSVIPVEPHGKALQSAIKTADKKHGG